MHVVDKSIALYPGGPKSKLSSGRLEKPSLPDETLSYGSRLNNIMTLAVGGT